MTALHGQLRWAWTPVVLQPRTGTLETCTLTTHANTGKHAFDLITPVGLYCLTARAALRLISPYRPILALNRMEFPEGFFCHQSNPIRYIVRGASHPVISATVARPRRRLAGTRQVHVYYSSIPKKAFPYNNIHIQSCDFVSQITLQFSRRRRRSAGIATLGHNLTTIQNYKYHPLNEQPQKVDC
jgi:hypothetical protein